MNLNKKAIMFLENNRHDLAFKTFKKALEDERTVQSLNNLAYYYSSEFDEFQSAAELLQEAIAMQPKHHFPYAHIGLVYCKMAAYKAALEPLKQSIARKDTLEARYNLAACYYQLGRMEEAAITLFPINRKDEAARLFYIRCLLLCEHNSDAKQALDTYVQSQMSPIDQIFNLLTIAELYRDLGCFSEALIWYEKAMAHYAHQPKWISGYIYTLIQTGKENKAQHIVTQEVVDKANEITEEIANADYNEDYTKEEQCMFINHLQAEKHTFETMIESIQKGVVPPSTFDPSYMESCYLFGCNRHCHAEY